MLNSLLHLIKGSWWILLLFTFSQSSGQILKGRVINKLSSDAVIGAHVRVSGGDKTFTADSTGHFTMQVSVTAREVEVSHVGYRSVRSNFRTDSFLVVKLEPAINELEEVVINTGYQKIPKERSTGSFDIIDNNLINRSVSTGFLKRIENLTPGLLFNHGDAASGDAFLIRGRSTLTANARPLVILDDFPYDGDLNNLNPNDIASVSILKDAAAASIWGARAGNGVIVITTKKGRSGSMRTEYTGNTTFTGTPDLYNVQRISPGDRIAMEKFLYEKGRYENARNPLTLAQRTSPIPEAAELMLQSPSDLDSRLAALGSQDVREDMKRYLYRTAALQQHNVNLSGGKENIQYYLSVGIDYNLSNLVGERYQRVSLQFSNHVKLNPRLQLETKLRIFNTADKKGNNKGYATSGSLLYGLSPYARLADETGTPQEVYGGIRQGFVDTVGRGLLLDWGYRPLDEIGNEKHEAKTADMVAGTTLSYSITDWLSTSMSYQYQNEQMRNTSVYSEESFHTRNIINNYSQINYSRGTVTYPVPRGALLSRTSRITNVHQGRAQLRAEKNWSADHRISAIAGYEIRKAVITGDVNQHYGYNEENGTINSAIDRVTLFPRQLITSRARVSLSQMTSEQQDNFLSAYFNGSYTMKQKYILSGSFRKDEANLFGVAANQKGVPLWSAGVAWNTSSESFYSSGWFPHLRVRTSYGVNGNISRLATAQPVITMSASGASHTLPVGRLRNPPNDHLSWEQVRQFNAAIEFGTGRNILTGTVEFYNKRAVNLLAETPIDPTYGVSSMYMNVASMSGSGIDVQLNILNLDKKLKWTTSFIYSFAATKVTDYLMPVSLSGSTYLPISLTNPLVGKPLYSVFGLAWQGLDPGTGDPLGLKDGEVSKDYNAIFYQTPPDGLVFKGTAQPTHFGSVLNQFSMGKFTLSFNISYKLGYYFRAGSIHYGGAFSSYEGHSDFGKRWIKPGDELTTDVPSMVYPADGNRDNFYMFSEVLIQRGDHVRFEDINFSYRLDLSGRKAGIRTVRLTGYCSNLGLLWKSSGTDQDPYYNNVPRPRPSFSFGTQITF